MTSGMDCVNAFLPLSPSPSVSLLCVCVSYRLCVRDSLFSVQAAEPLVLWHVLHRLCHRPSLRYQFHGHSILFLDKFHAPSGHVSARLSMPCSVTLLPSLPFIHLSLLPFRILLVGGMMVPRFIALLFWLAFIPTNPVLSVSLVISCMLQGYSEL